MTKQLGWMLAAAALTMPATRAQTPAPAAPPTAESLVARTIEAEGGLDRIKAIRTFRQSGTLATPDLPAPVPLVLYAKRPNLARQDVDLPGGAVVVGFDGVTAWKIDPLAGSPAPAALSGAEADAVEEQSNFDSPLVDYQARGSSIRFAGAETFGGKRVNRLDVTDKKGRVQQVYLDADTGFEVRIVSSSGTGPLEQQLSDYRAVQGVQFPFFVRSLTGGRLAATITITRIELNVPLDDALFKMPK